MAKVFTQYESAKLTYGIDWSGQLVNENDGNGTTISVSTWTSDPSGLTLTNKRVDNGNTRALVTCSGGATGTVYTLTNHITMANGEEDEERITLRIV